AVVIRQDIVGDAIQKWGIAAVNALAMPSRVAFELEGNRRFVLLKYPRAGATNRIPWVVLIFRLARHDHADVARQTGDERRPGEGRLVDVCAGIDLLEGFDGRGAFASLVGEFGGEWREP